MLDLLHLLEGSCYKWNADPNSPGPASVPRQSGLIGGLAAVTARLRELKDRENDPQSEHQNGDHPITVLHYPSFRGHLPRLRKTTLEDTRLNLGHVWRVGRAQAMNVTLPPLPTRVDLWTNVAS